MFMATNSVFNGLHYQMVRLVRIVQTGKVLWITDHLGSEPRLGQRPYLRLRNAR